MDGKRIKKAKRVMIGFLNAWKNMKFSGKQKSYYEWLFKNGEWFTDKRKVEQYEKIGQCYYNAQMYAIGRPKVKYFEGWGVTEGLFLPLEHGFNVIGNKVYDNTWNDGLAYFGVHIPTNFVVEHILNTGYSDSLLGNYWIKEIRKDKS